MAYVYIYIYITTTTTTTNNNTNDNNDNNNNNNNNNINNNHNNNNMTGGIGSRVDGEPIPVSVKKTLLRRRGTQQNAALRTVEDASARVLLHESVLMRVFRRE